MNEPFAHPIHPSLSRRDLLGRLGAGVGTVALSQLLTTTSTAAKTAVGLHFPARAKRVISLFQSGAPSQIDLFDYKPLLNERHGDDLPASVRRGQRLTTMTANQARWPLAGSPFKFKQHGASGAWLSEALPYTARMADDICFVKSMYTEAINHDPAITFLQTGSQLAGRPSLGAWLNYGLGSANENLPACVVLITKGQGGQPGYGRLWGSGFLPASHQGVRFRTGKDPVLFLNNPDGVSLSLIHICRCRRLLTC